jgi:hypothetical protein
LWHNFMHICRIIVRNYKHISQWRNCF